MQTGENSIMEAHDILHHSNLYTQCYYLQ